MSLPDYFKLKLQTYLDEHGFENDEIDDDFVEMHADSANEIFVLERHEGWSVSDAIDLASVALFSGVGDSNREVISEILINNFKDRIVLNDPTFLEFWLQNISLRKEMWEPYRKEDGIGLDPVKVEEHREEIIESINQYLTVYGL